jgi:hypothetical protein
MKIKQMIIILTVIGAGLAAAFVVGEVVRRMQPVNLDDPFTAGPGEPNLAKNDFQQEVEDYTDKIRIPTEVTPIQTGMETVESQTADSTDPELAAAPSETLYTGTPTNEASPPTAEANPSPVPGPTPVPANQANPAPGIDPHDPHRFIMNGEPWYPAGYYPSIAALTADQTDYVNYYRLLIDKLAENNINLFRNVFTMGQPYGESMTPYQRTGPGEAADGRPRFDLDQYNQAYFDYWREVVSYANSKGVIVQLTIFDNWHNKGNVVHSGSNRQMEWGMKHDFYNGANNINGIDASNLKNWHNPSRPVFEYQKALIRHVVDNLGDLPNIIYEISNENYTSESWELMLADYLSDYEQSLDFPRHLVMPRDLPNHDSAGGKGNDPERVHQELIRNYSLNQPLIADNDGGGHVNPEGRRKKAWAALTAGAHINYFHFELFRTDVLNSQDAADGMRYIGYTRKFLDDLQVDLRGMAPMDQLVSRGWCYARPGESYIIYLINGGATQVEALPEQYEAYWYNPRDGSVVPAEGGPSFTSPDGSDWVLYIIDS